MKFDLYYSSKGAGRIRGRRWMPEVEPRAVLQIVHGIAEHIERYDAFASYLNAMGYIVVAEDHMGHGKSAQLGSTQGYFHGGWDAAVDDTYQLLKYTHKKYPDLPYILFGHSMGSFMARTILSKYPDSGIAAAIICGTGWQDEKLLKAAGPVCRMICKVGDESKPSKMLQNVMFGSYNARIDNPRTPSDWLTRDEAIVDAYIEDPMCGFIPSAGLVRDMLGGITWIQQEENLAAMKKDLPVFFIAGSEDPVGGYGSGVEACAQAFRDAGMERVAVKLYPDCRHEILNELDKLQVYADIVNWSESVTKE